MQYLLVTLIALTLIACQPAKTRNVSHDFIMPEPIKDCELVKLTPSGYSSDAVYILNCPDGVKGTSTSITRDKARKTNSVVII